MTLKPSLHTKLAEVMKLAGRVPKNGRNEFHKYDYVTEGDLVDAVRDHLADRHITLIPSVEDVQPAGELTYVKVLFTFTDGETGETFSGYGAGCGQDKGDKGVYKAMTGAEKYFIMKTFLISTGDDPERDTGPTPAASKAKAKAKPPAKLTSVQQDEIVALSVACGQDDAIARTNAAKLTADRYHEIRANLDEHLKKAGRSAAEVLLEAGLGEIEKVPAA